VRGEDSTLGLVRGEERRFAKSSQANLDNNTLLSRIVSLGHLHIAQAPKSSLSSSVRSSNYPMWLDNLVFIKNTKNSSKNLNLKI
jgi:hypothetical protein